MLLQLEKKVDPCISIKDGIDMTTVANSFRKAGFVLPSPTSEEDTPVTVTDTAATDDIPTSPADVQQENNNVTWSRLQSCLSVDVTYPDDIARL